MTISDSLTPLIIPTMTVPDWPTAVDKLHQASLEAVDYSLQKPAVEQTSPQNNCDPEVAELCQ
jgi:hypothetical protein